MYKKLLIVTAIISSLIFSVSVCFANNLAQDAANGAKNLVGGAENTIEGAVKGVSNASKDATANFENGANNMTNEMMNNNNSDNNNHNYDGTNVTSTTGNNANNYTATRTGATDNTFMGMNSTVWTWLILGIVAIAIVALVWYYSTQVSSNRYNDRD